VRQSLCQIARANDPAIADLQFFLGSPAPDNALTREMNDRVETRNYLGGNRLRRIPRDLILARTRPTHQTCDFVSASFERRKKRGPNGSGNTADQNSGNHGWQCTLAAAGACEQARTS